MVGRIPPNYGAATVEKIAANAVMAGCRPEMMRVLVPLVRAACDERFNLHGVQATTHFAAPLIIVNGPVRQELGFWSRQNVFSNVARANSTLGRALQLILLNLGGARPDAIDMSTLGNPGKFSFCIAENEEENPWPTAARGPRVCGGDRAPSTLFAGEPPHGVSEHTARSAPACWQGAGRRARHRVEPPIVRRPRGASSCLCPEHVKTIHRDGWSKETAPTVPLRPHRRAGTRLSRRRGGEGTQHAANYAEVVDRRRALLPQVRVASRDPPRRRGWHRGQVLGGDWQLVDGPARQSDGHVCGREGRIEQPSRHVASGLSMPTLR